MAIDLVTLRNIVGIIGNVTSLFLFLSPLPTIFLIWKDKTAQGYQPDPYVATVLNCAMWVLYGMPFVHPDSLLIVTVNGVGLFIEAFYLVIFLIYADWPKRRKILISLLVEALFVIVVVIITMLFLHTTESRSMFVGVMCIVFSVMMYASPLTIMSKVIRTKSVKYMPFFLSLANFVNGICWSTYALIKLDIYVLVPNGLGSLSGLVQLVLYASYYKTTNWDEDIISPPEKPVNKSSTTTPAAPQAA